MSKNTAWNNSEIDFAVMKLSNMARKKGVVISDEFEHATTDFSKKEKKEIIKNIQKLGFEYRENMILFKDKINNNPIKEKDLLSYLIRPEYINTHRSHIQMGAQFYQCIHATGFPAEVRKNWLGKLIQEKGNVDFTLHLQPSSIRGLELYLNSQLKQVENDLYKYRMKGLHNPSLENRKKELLQQLNSLIRGDYKLYRMSLYLAGKAGNLKDAETISKRILSSLHADGIEGDGCVNYQEQIMKSLIPVGDDYLKQKILVPGPAAAASFPFSSSFYEVDEEDGVLLGFNDNGIPIGKSIWKLPKYIGAVLGATGSGKSYAAKALLLNDQMVHGTKMFILDPEGEYLEMARNLDNSQIISLNRKSKTIPNIMDLMGSELIDKLSSLSRVFDVLLEGVSDIQKPLLEEALIETYRKKGITENPKTWKKKAPILSDVIDVLIGFKKKCTDGKIRENYEVLISKLSRYTKGIYKFLNHNGKMNLKGDVIVFEFSEMTEEIRPIMMLILLEFIKTKFNQGKEKKMLVLDEAWRMLKSKQEADYVESFARTFRKRNGGMLLITQSVAELKDSPEGKAVLANTSFRYLLKTENVVLDETCNLFGLNKSEKDILANARPGQGVLVWEDKHYKINVHVDPETHKIITTNPNE